MISSSSSSMASSSASSSSSSSSAPSSAPSSPPPSSMAECGDQETYGPAGTGPKVVRRGGHIIPMIRLTPPDSRPCASLQVPEQELGKNCLYVPLRTEEVGWEEGGLIWAPKRYWYPTVNLYGGVDDHVIGSYRGGPKGYSFVSITDPAFKLAQTDASTAALAATSNDDSRRNRSKSALPRAHVATTANSEQEMDTESTGAKTVAQALEDQVEESVATAAEHKEAYSKAEEKAEETPKATESTFLIRRSSSVSSASASSSASTSRRGSSSTFFDDDEEAGSGANTGMTTPAECESPMEVDAKMADELDAALHALKEEEMSIEPASDGHQAKLASRVGTDVVMDVPKVPIDAARLGGPFQASLQHKSASIGLDRSLLLSPCNPTSQRFSSPPRGRSTSRPSEAIYVTPKRYDAGWAFEENTMRQWQ